MEKKTKPNHPHVVKSGRRGGGEKEPNQTKLHIVKIREGPAGGEWKEIMKPNQQLHLETIWLLLSREEMENKTKPNQTKLHVVWSWGPWVKKTKPNQVARGVELGNWVKKTKPNQVARGVELGSLGKENQTKLHVVWSWGPWVRKAKPNQVARGVEFEPLVEENQTKPSCTWCGVGAPG
jgi:hypothetical protein